MLLSLLRKFIAFLRSGKVGKWQSFKVFLEAFSGCPLQSFYRFVSLSAVEALPAKR
jgi:hypothetical protein